MALDEECRADEVRARPLSGLLTWVPLKHSLPEQSWLVLAPARPCSKDQSQQQCDSLMALMGPHCAHRGTSAPDFRVTPRNCNPHTECVGKHS